MSARIKHLALYTENTGENERGGELGFKKV